MVANMIKNDIDSTFVGSDELAYPMPEDEHGKIIFYAVNTDAQALRKSNVQQTVQIGGATTKGLVPVLTRMLVVKPQKMIRMLFVLCWEGCRYGIYRSRYG